jgi:hypothetical protein
VRVERPEDMVDRLEPCFPKVKIGPKSCRCRYRSGSLELVRL